jgi:hypothetical protein
MEEDSSPEKEKKNLKSHNSPSWKIERMSFQGFFQICDMLQMKGETYLVG